MKINRLNVETTIAADAVYPLVAADITPDIIDSKKTACQKALVADIIVAVNTLITKYLGRDLRKATVKETFECTAARSLTLQHFPLVADSWTATLYGKSYDISDAVVNTAIGSIFFQEYVTGLLVVSYSTAPNAEDISLAKHAGKLIAKNAFFAAIRDSSTAIESESIGGGIGNITYDVSGAAHLITPEVRQLLNPLRDLAAS